LQIYKKKAKIEKKRKNHQTWQKPGIFRLVDRATKILLFATFWSAK
jgi:hypothetical protein